MDFLSNLKSSANSAEMNLKSIMEKSLAWSSSVIEEASFSKVRNAFVLIGRSIEPKNLEQKTLSWFSSATLYIEANPIIFSVRLPNSIGNCNSVQTYVNLPYLGAVSLDVFLFWSSAILIRAHMFWNSRHQHFRNKGGGTTRENGTRKSLGSQSPPSSPVKSTIVTGYKDKGLHKTMEECQDIKISLRKTSDPELKRKEKKSRLTLQNIRSKIEGENSSDGYLGMSPSSLRDARRFLRQVSPSQTPREYSELV